MSDRRSRYPDISGILARKARGRRERAALSFAEKLDLLEALRERVAPIIRAREMRKQGASHSNQDTPKPPRARTGMS
jgi:hypothetical protein